MKPHPRTIKRITNHVAYAVSLALGFAATSAFALEPHDSGAGKICGKLRTFEGDVQVFDRSRTHLGEASFGTKLSCGDWISVDSGRATVETGDGSAILVSGKTFIQILDPQSGTNPERANVALYRGEFLVQAGKHPLVVVTPNAVATAVDGGVLVVYATHAEESQIVGLGGRGTLANRFFLDKKMTTEFAKVVTFSNPVERILPEESRFVNARELNLKLTSLGMDKTLQESVEKAVKAGSKTKLPVSLANRAKASGGSTIGGAGEFVPAQGSALPVRAPASVAEAPVDGAATALPKKPVARKKPAARKIASETPDFNLKREANEAAERQRLLQALSKMEPAEE